MPLLHRPPVPVCIILVHLFTKFYVDKFEWMKRRTVKLTNTYSSWCRACQSRLASATKLQINYSNVKCRNICMQDTENRKARGMRYEVVGQDELVKLCHTNHRSPFLSASLYFSKRGAYWDRLCRDVVGWLVVTRVHCGQTVHPRPIVTMEH